LSQDSKPFIVGVAGGSGSGKTTVVNMIKKAYLGDEITIIREDHYYRDLSHLSKEDQNKVNFDHPDSLDSDLMIDQVKTISQGKSIDCPIYDFKTRIRTKADAPLPASKIIFFDGILSFHHRELRDLFDLMVYVDVPADIRILRRTLRDVTERGREIEGVITQYLNTVRPMHERFVEPTKKYANQVISWVDRDPRVIDDLLKLLPVGEL